LRWCAVTRTYEKPFEDNKYTIAGKIIEPKVIEYLKKLYFGGSLKSPTDVYGQDYFQKTWGDFFPDVEIFGGMWDALAYNDKGEVESVIESKPQVGWKIGQMVKPLTTTLYKPVYTLIS